MEIKPNDLLKPIKRVIKPYECSLLAVDGPRVQGRWHLEGLQIPYDSQFTSVMELEAGSEPNPIIYGHVGSEITFLAIRVVYASRDQKTSAARFMQDDKYIEYFYEDDTETIRTMADLLVLTGNDLHRIPQIWVKNPTEYTAELHIMAANKKENLISKKLLPSQNVFSGLYYYSILSDKYNFTPSVEGSSQFQIYDVNSNLLISIAYENVNVIEKDGENLIIKTYNDENIILEFVSEFHAYQARSRMEWVREDAETRYLTVDSPAIDDEGPVIEAVDVPILQYTGTTVSHETLLENIISGVTDDRDGIMSKYDLQIEIKKVGSIRHFDEINEIGNYIVTFIAQDLAGNKTYKDFTVSMYATAPKFVFNTNTNLNTMYINDTFYYKSEYDENIISESDIVDYYIDCIEDYVDGLIDKENVVVTIDQLSGSSSGLTDSGITLVGDYDVTLSITNGGGLTTTENRILKIYTNNDVLPQILWNTGYEDSNISIDTGTTSIANDTQLLDLIVSGVSSDYDTTIEIDDIEVTGDFPLETGTYELQLTNYSGRITIETKQITVT
jgi:hypothetical protein